jgi:hypothetical protein
MVKIFIEGGGDSDAQYSKFREAMRVFLEKAGVKGRMPRMVFCGGRKEAFDDYKTEIKDGKSAYLLVDSEEAVKDTFQEGEDMTKWKPWGHLKQRTGDKWEKPKGAEDNQCHLMVQCMENWFLADSAALKNVFTKGFKERKLPVNKQIETIGKTEAYDALEAATKDNYSKGRNSFKILAEIDPAKVTSASPWAKRFVDTLKTATST